MLLRKQQWDMVYRGGRSSLDRTVASTAAAGERQHMPLLSGAKCHPRCPSGWLRALFAFFPQLHIHLISL